MMLVLLSSVILVMLVYFLYLMLGYKNDVNEASLSPFECGFDSSSVTRMPFSYRFFLISILFLIFDVEIILLLPIPYLVKSMNGIWVFNILMVILALGVMYEYYYGSLDWLSLVSKA